MIPVRLELKNFLAYRAPQPVVLEGVRLACLVGENGAGKSSLLDAVTWALWGKARTRRDNDLIHLGAADMYVQLDFDHEGQRYRVVRRRERRGSSGTGRLDLFIYGEDGALNEIREGSSTATQQRIIDLLHLDYETFINSAFLQQGQADLFTTQQPAKRKQILSNILGLEAWAAFERDAKKQRDDFKAQVNVLDGRLKQIEEDLATEPSKRRELVDAQHAEEAANSELETAEKLLDDVKDAPGDLRAAQDSQHEHKRRKGEYERELEQVRGRIQRQTQQIAAYREILDSREEIEQGYQNWQSAREASDELNEKLRALKGIDSRLSELERELATERTKLESEREALEKQIAQLQKQIDSADAAELQAVQAQLTDLETKSTKREALQQQITDLTGQHAEIVTEQKTLWASMQELRERIDTLEVVEGAECPLCGQPLTDDHRAEMLAALQTQGEAQRDEYAANLERKKEIEATKEQAEAQARQLTDELADLPRLQSRAGELQAQQQAAEEAGRQHATAVERLDEVRAALENDDYAPDVRAQLAALQKEKEALGYDENAHDEQAAALKSYRKYEEMHAQLTVAANSLPPLEEAQQASQGREQELVGNIAALDEELVTIEQQISELNVLVETFKQREKDVLRLRTAASNAREKVVVARQALNALAEKREKKQEYTALRDEFTEQAALYDELAAAFGKNGVPAMIIETAIPELEGIANDLLTRMTDGRMAVMFSTQREKVTGGTSETLDIAIADELGTRGYEMYSGGEAFRINFAIRVALSKLLARRAGAHLETLFIDEGFGTQDADGRTRLVEAINAIKDDFDLILAITHIDDLKDAFPVHINVTKTPSGSTVSVQ